MTLLGHDSPIDVKQGNGYIEVLPNKLTKEKYLTCMLQDLKNYSKQKIESLLYIGTDLTDDTVFSFIKGLVEKDRQHSIQGH